MRDPHPYWTYSDDDIDSRPMSASGYASTLPTDREDDTIARLHEVVAEVTGKPVEKKEKPRLGFL